LVHKILSVIFNQKERKGRVELSMEGRRVGRRQARTFRRSAFLRMKVYSGVCRFMGEGGKSKTDENQRTRVRLTGKKGREVYTK